MSTERSLEFPESFLHRELKHPAARHKFVRSVVIKLLKLTHIAPTEVIEVQNSLNRASDLIKEGYSLCALGTHCSKREGPELIARPAILIPAMLGLPVVLPVSLHQYLGERRLINSATGITGITTAPVVNQDAMEVKNKDFIEERLGRPITLGEGLPQYVRLVGNSFNTGGFVGIAPQGGRRKTIELPQANPAPLKLLLKHNNITRDDKIAFLFMSMIPQGKANYEDIYDHLNLRMKYKIVFSTLTLSELYGLLDRMNEQLAQKPVEEGKTRLTIDELVLIILSLPFGPDYNKINPSYGDRLASIDNTGTMKDMMERGLFPPQVLE